MQRTTNTTTRLALLTGRPSPFALSSATTTIPWQQLHRTPLFSAASALNFGGRRTLQSSRTVPPPETSDAEARAAGTGDYTQPHPLWDGEDILAVREEHTEPADWIDRLALRTVQTMRFNFDWMSGFTLGRRTESKWLTRIMFLETVAAVPGSIAAILRHLGSLRRMQRDHGWIHTLLEEAENERMHLLVATQLKQPSRLFRLAVLLTQGIFFNFFWVAYLLKPRFCHRLVGYLEEEAVKTYSKAIADMDDPNGPLHHWNSTPAPEIARDYWRMEKDATLRDVVYMIRADEAHHRLVNHNFATMNPNEPNPFRPGE